MHGISGRQAAERVGCTMTSVPEEAIVKVVDGSQMLMATHMPHKLCVSCILKTKMIVHNVSAAGTRHNINAGTIEGWGA